MSISTEKASRKTQTAEEAVAEAKSAVPRKAKETLDKQEDSSADDAAPGLELDEGEDKAKEGKETEEPIVLDEGDTDQLNTVLNKNPILAGLPPARKERIISRLRATGDSGLSFEEVSAILADFLAKLGVDLGELSEEEEEEIRKFENFVHSPSDFGDNSPGSDFEYTGDDNIAKAAMALRGSTDFQGPEVDGGRLACAQFVTTVLKQTGYLNNVILGVDLTASTLQKRGWRRKPVNKPPSAGDVIVWGKTGDRVRDGYVAKGHGHIGIAIGPHDCISNSSRAKMPRRHRIGNAPQDEGGYWDRRGIAMILTPPSKT